MDGSFLRIVHNRRGLNGIIGDILMLMAITHVDFAPLALPEVRHGTRPDSGFDNNYAILLGTVQGICHRVAHTVTVGTQDPSRVTALARFVERDWLQS